MQLRRASVRSSLRCAVPRSAQSRDGHVEALFSRLLRARHSSARTGSRRAGQTGAAILLVCPVCIGFERMHRRTPSRRSDSTSALATGGPTRPAQDCSTYSPRAPMPKEGRASLLQHSPLTLKATQTEWDKANGDALPRQCALPYALSSAFRKLMPRNIVL